MGGQDTPTPPAHGFPLAGSYYFLWCPDHGTFWGETRHSTCVECGYMTYPIEPHPLVARFHALLEEMRETHDRKNADYGRDEDPLANVRASQAFGVKPWVGAMIRAHDKIIRIQSFALKGELKNEPLIDAFMDLAVYALIARILYEEEQGI